MQYILNSMFYFTLFIATLFVIENSEPFMMGVDIVQSWDDLIFPSDSGVEEYTYSGVRWDEPVYVCAIEPERDEKVEFNDEFKLFVEDGIFIWVLNMRLFSFGNDGQYDVGFEWITYSDWNYYRQPSECNVFIKFLHDSKQDWTDKEYTLGKRVYNIDQFLKKTAMITVFVYQYDRVEIITNDIEDPIRKHMNGPAIRQIIAHEMGHALGLSHYYSALLQWCGTRYS